MKKYQLINPYIVGGFKTTVHANCPIDAGKKLWSDLSDNIVGYTPKFYFSLRNVKKGGLYHFSATEEHDDEDTITFKIDEIDGKVDELKLVKKIKSHLNSLKNQVGGKHHKSDDSSSSSSSTDSDEKLIKAIKKSRKRSPISFVDYFPSIYTDRNSVYVPTFGLTTHVVPGDLIPIPPRIYLGPDLLVSGPIYTTADAETNKIIVEWNKTDTIAKSIIPYLI